MLFMIPTPEVEPVYTRHLEPLSYRVRSSAPPPTWLKYRPPFRPLNSPQSGCLASIPTYRAGRLSEETIYRRGCDRIRGRIDRAGTLFANAKISPERLVDPDPRHFTMVARRGWCSSCQRGR